MDTNSNISTPSGMTPSQEVQIEPEISQKNKTPAFLLSLVAILGVLLILSLLYIVNISRRQASISQSVNPVTSTSPSPALAQANSVAYAYIKSGELWVQNNNGSSKQVTSTNQGVLKFVPTNDNSEIAFISGDKVTNSSSYSYIVPKSVSIFSLGSGKTKQIFSLIPKTGFKNSEYQIAISDINFSDDAIKLAITTSDSLYVYDTKTGIMENEFTKPRVDTQDASGIFGYSKPIFAPDKSKIVFVASRYEGSGTGWIDVASKKVTTLPFGMGYGGGQSILGWENNTTIIVHEASEGKVSRIQAVPIDSPAQTTDIVDASFTAGILHNGIVYGVSIHQSVGKTPVLTIDEIDLQSHSVNQITNTAFSGSGAITKISYSDSLKSLFIQIDSNKIYSVDLNQPVQLIQMIENALL